MGISTMKIKKKVVVKNGKERNLAITSTEKQRKSLNMSVSLRSHLYHSCSIFIFSHKLINI